jgi:hypothetical protein
MQALITLSDAILQRSEAAFLSLWLFRLRAGPPTWTNAPLPQAEGNSAVARNAALGFTQIVYILAPVHNLFL